MNGEQDNILLQEKVDSLTQKNDQLKKYISSLQELLGSDICKFFEITNSIKQTKTRFCYETVRECYGDLVYFYGCNDPIQYADDYKECYKDIFGIEYQDDDDTNDETNDETNDDTNDETNDDTNDETNDDTNDAQYMFGSSIENIFHLICKDLIENTHINPGVNVE